MGRKETERGGVWRLKTEDGWRVNGPRYLARLSFCYFGLWRSVVVWPNLGPFNNHLELFCLFIYLFIYKILCVF